MSRAESKETSASNRVSGRTGRAWIRAIQNRITESAFVSGDKREWALRRMAGEIVKAAAAGSANSYQHVITAIYGGRIPAELLPAPVPLVTTLANVGGEAPALPARNRFFESVDGRDGFQWTDSVLAYLRFRSGAAWRRFQDRKHSQDFEDYSTAVWFVTQAIGKSDADCPPCSCSYCATKTEPGPVSQFPVSVPRVTGTRREHFAEAM